MAAPSKYETHVKPKLALVEMWARDGLTQDQIADNLGVARSTFYKYQREHSELLDALSNGREVANATVVNALYQSAIGFTYREQVMTPKGEIKEINRYAKPNVSAIQFWLKNKLPDEWNDKQDVALSGDIKQVVIVNDLEDDGDAPQS